MHKIQSAINTSHANELARAIEAWDGDKTDHSYSVALWGLCVDALSEKTVFVPTSFSDDGDIKAIGPADKDGNRFYVCHINLPDKLEYDCMAYSEIAIPAFLQMALDDRKAIGLAIYLDDICFLISKEILIDRTQKIGMIQNEENKNATENGQDSILHRQGRTFQ